MKISRLLAAFITRNHFRLFLVGLFFTLFFLVFSRPPVIDGNLAGNVSHDSEFYKIEKKIESIFQNHQIIHLKIVPGNVPLSSLMSGLQILKAELIKGFPISTATSIQDFQSFFYLEKISESGPVQSELLKLKKIPFVKHLISHDSKSLLLELKVVKGQQIDPKVFDSVIEKKFVGIKSMKAMSSFHIEKAIAENIEADIVVLLGLILVLCLGVFFYAFRSIKVVLLTLFLLILSVTPITFFMGVLDIKANIVTILVFPVVLILLLADVIHLITGWQHSRNLENVIEMYILPSFLTSITTAVAFLSFADNEIENIRQFGMVTSVSVLAEFFLVFLLAPYLLTKMPIKPKNANNLLSVAVSKLLFYKRRIGQAFIVVFFLGLFMAPSLKFNTTMDSFFPRKSKVYADHEELKEDFNSMMNLSVLVGPPKYPDIPGFKWNKTDVAQVSYLISNRLKKNPQVTSQYSINEIVDYYLYNGMTSDKWDDIKYPNPLNVDEHFLITAKVQSPDDIPRIYTDLKKIVKPFEARAQISITSPVLLFNEVDYTLARQLLISLLTSSFSIILVFYFLTRSVRNTLIALYANLVPISLMAILFYVFNLHLNLVTALTSVICLGIVVDDSIHVLYRLCYRKDQELHKLGDGMLTTSVILALGFGSLILSNFEPTQVFGLISSFVFTIAVLADLTLLTYGVIQEPKGEAHVS